MARLALRLLLVLVVSTLALSIVPAAASRRDHTAPAASSRVAASVTSAAVEPAVALPLPNANADVIAAATPNATSATAPADPRPGPNGASALDITHTSSFYENLAREAAALGFSSVPSASGGAVTTAPPPASPSPAADSLTATDLAPKHPSLPRRVPRVAVVGGGLTGAATAFFLSEYFRPAHGAASETGKKPTNYVATSSTDAESAKNSVKIDVYERTSRFGGQMEALLFGAERENGDGHGAGDGADKAGAQNSTARHMHVSKESLHTAAGILVSTPFLADVASGMSLCAGAETPTARAAAIQTAAAESRAKEAVDAAIITPALEILKPRLSPDWLSQGGSSAASASEASVLYSLCLLRGAVRAARTAAAALTRAHAELSAPLASFMDNIAHLSPLHTVTGVVQTLMQLSPHAAADKTPKTPLRKDSPHASSKDLQVAEPCPCSAARATGGSSATSVPEAALLHALSSTEGGAYFSALGGDGAADQFALLDAPTESMWRLASRALGPLVCTDPAFKYIEHSVAVTPRLDLLGTALGLPRALAAVIGTPAILREWNGVLLAKAGRAPRPTRAHVGVRTGVLSTVTWTAEAVALFARVSHGLAHPMDKEAARVYLFESCFDATLLVSSAPDKFIAAAATVLGCSTHKVARWSRLKTGPAGNSALPLSDLLLAHADCGSSLGVPRDALPQPAAPCFADVSRLVSSLLKRSGATLRPHTGVSRMNLAPAVGNLKPLYTLTVSEENASVASAAEPIVYDYVVIAAPLSQTGSHGEGAAGVDARILRADRAFEFYHTSLTHTAAQASTSKQVHRQLQVISGVGVPGPLALTISGRLTLRQQCAKTAAAAERLSAFCKRSGKNMLVTGAVRFHALLASALALASDNATVAVRAQTALSAAKVVPLGTTVSLMDALQSVVHETLAQLNAKHDLTTAALAAKPWLRLTGAVAAALAEDLLSATPASPLTFVPEPPACTVERAMSQECVLRQQLSLRHQLALQAVQIPIAAIRYSRVFSSRDTTQRHCLSAAFAATDADPQDAALASVLPHSTQLASSIGVYTVPSEHSSLYYRPYSYFTAEQAQTSHETGSPFLSALSHAHQPTSIASSTVPATSTVHSADATNAASSEVAPPPLRVYGHNVYYPNALTAPNELTLPPLLETGLLAARAVALLVAEDIAHPRRSTAEHFGALSKERMFARLRLSRTDAVERDAAGAIAPRLYSNLESLVTVRSANPFAPPLEAVAGAIRDALFPVSSMSQADAAKGNIPQVREASRKLRRRSRRTRGKRVRSVYRVRSAAAAPPVSPAHRPFVNVCPLPSLTLAGCSQLGDHWGTEDEAAKAAARGEAANESAGGQDGAADPVVESPQAGSSTASKERHEKRPAEAEKKDEAASPRRAGWQPSRRPARNALHELDQTATNVSMRRREARIKRAARVNLFSSNSSGDANLEQGRLET